jgi:hypothetical protein
MTMRDTYPHAGAGTASERAVGIGLKFSRIRNAPSPIIQEPM